jgi:hypothetical protein
MCLSYHLLLLLYLCCRQYLVLPMEVSVIYSFLLGGIILAWVPLPQICSTSANLSILASCFEKNEYRDKISAVRPAFDVCIVTLHMQSCKVAEA